MPPELFDRYRTELLDGCVTPAFYEQVYLPYAAGVQSRTVENLQRVSRGKVTASVLLGAKQAAAPLAYRVFADTVAVMAPDQLRHLAAQIFDAAGE